jgi:hypothetical protein
VSIGVPTQKRPNGAIEFGRTVFFGPCVQRDQQGHRFGVSRIQVFDAQALLPSRAKTRQCLQPTYRRRQWAGS